jgi:hypothetical protein
LDPSTPRPGPVYPLSTAEKDAALRAREKRWEMVDAKYRRKMTVEGSAGVYELQEGIFLMCDDYTDTDEPKVCGS